MEGVETMEKILMKEGRRKAYEYGDFCGANARVVNGKIELCLSALQKDFNDILAITTHEYFHLAGDKPCSMIPKSIPIPITIDAPEEFRNYVWEKNGCDLIEKSDPDRANREYKNSCTYTRVMDPVYYENEISVYEKEIAMFPNVSSAYQTERQYALWQAKELLKLAQKYYHQTK